MTSSSRSPIPKLVAAATANPTPTCSRSDQDQGDLQGREKSTSGWLPGARGWGERGVGEGPLPVPRGHQSIVRRDELEQSSSDGDGS